MNKQTESLEEEKKETTRINSLVTGNYDIIPVGFDTSVFRKEAIFFSKNGFFTDTVEDTPQFFEYWDKQIEYCLDGIEIGGVSITGFHYFYLNFCTIEKVITKKIIRRGKVIEKSSKAISFPDFYDYDKFYFDIIENASDEGKHLVVLKSRRKGYSFKGASMLCRNFYLKRNSKNFVIAADMSFLTSDGILTKAWDMISFIDEHTAWGKAKDKFDTKIHKRASYEEVVAGRRIEKGYKSEIIGRTIKDDAQKLRGISGDLILFEEAGKNRLLLEAWMVVESSLSQGTDTYGTMIAFGTGGTVGADYEGLKELFYKPEAYGCYALDNIWDIATTTKSGFFVPDFAHLEGFIDENGISQCVEAYEFEKKKREQLETGADATAIDRRISEHPFCLHGDTWVSIRNNKDNITLSRIKDVPERFNNGIQDIYEVLTKQGRRLLCTLDHLIYDGIEYRPLSDYKIGEKIQLLNPVFSDNYQTVTIDYHVAGLMSKIVIDEDWGKFIGFYMGDGWFYSSKYIYELGVCFDKKDESSLQWVYDFIIRKQLGNPRIEYIKGLARVRVTNVYLLDLLKQLDLIKREGDAAWKRNVHVPDYIMKSKESVIGGFLSGMFDSDGSIALKQGYIALSTMHQRFAEDILILLQGFGIQGRYNKVEKTNGEGRIFTQRVIRLLKQDNSLFYEKIGFVSSRKNNILKDNLISKKTVINTDDSILSIQYHSTDTVYNMKTNCSFYSANGIWTHNSPSEATLTTHGNIFPQKKLMEQLSWVETTQRVKEKDQRGELIFNHRGEVEWMQDNSLRAIVEFPLDKKSSIGCIQIWEHPYHDPETNKIPDLMYISSTDPYDHDQSNSGSLGSTFIFKRFYILTEQYDILVAEYTARPETADEYYENVRLLLLYYNAKNLYENNIKGMHTYFKNKNSEYLLVDTPETKDIIKDSKVRRTKGIHMTPQVIREGEKLIKKYLLEFDGKAYGYQKIYSIPLLKELISYNIVGNFDRIRALQVLLLYKQELFSYEVKVVKKQETFFPKSIFVAPPNNRFI